jgi:hypothetical protein
VLRTKVARFRVQAVRSSVCFEPEIPGQNPVCPDSAHVNTPLLGVLMYSTYRTVFDSNDDPQVSYWAFADSGYTLFGAGEDPSGFIKWDPSTSVVEKPKQ